MVVWDIDGEGLTLVPPAKVFTAVGPTKLGGGRFNNTYIRRKSCLHCLYLPKRYGNVHDGLFM